MVNALEKKYWCTENKTSVSKEYGDQIKGKIKILLEISEEHEFFTELIGSLDTLLIGQKDAKNAIWEAIVSKILSFREKKWTLWNFFFAWPTWVWKTEMVKALAKSLLWDPNAYTHIWCETFQESHSARDIFWAPKSYIWYWEPTVLDYNNVFWHFENSILSWEINNMIRNLEDFSIILFDEIEKAHPKIHQGLLWLMNEWKITFPDWSTTEFQNSIIIFTSNIWEKDIQSNSAKQSFGFLEKNTKEKDSKKIRDRKIKEVFSPEFLSRVDKTIEFNSLTKQEAKEIIDLHIKMLNEQIDSFFKFSDIQIELSENSYDEILNKWFSKEKWARELIRYIDQKIESKLNILFNSENFKKYTLVDTPVTITIDFENEKFQFYVEYHESNIQINKKSKKNQNTNLIKWISENPLKTLDNIYKLITEYSETYDLALEWEIDLREELEEYEIQFKELWFSKSDIILIRNKSYVKSLKDLNYITTFRWVDLYWWKKEEIFKPLKQRDVYKIVEKTVVKYFKINLWMTNIRITDKILNNFWSNDFEENLLIILMEKIQKSLKYKEKSLTVQQKQKILIFVKKALIENFN